MQTLLNDNIDNPQRNRQCELEPKSQQHQKDATPNAWTRQFSVHGNRLRLGVKGASANVS